MSQPVSADSSSYGSAYSEFLSESADLVLDRHMQAEVQGIATTVILFLLALVESTENKQQSFAAAAKTWASNCGMDPAFAVTDIMDLLGSVSVLVPKWPFVDVFMNPKAYEDILHEQKSISIVEIKCRNTYDSFKSSNPQTQVTLDTAFGKSETFSTYQWHLLREMLYYSFTILRKEDLRPRGTQDQLDPMDELSHWIMHQMLDDEKLGSGKKSYPVWYSTWVWKKRGKLGAVVKLLEGELGRLRQEEGERREMSRLEKLAAWSEMTEGNGKIWTDFKELESLKGIFQGENQRWERVLAERALRGKLDPRHTGFENVWRAPSGTAEVERRKAEESAWGFEPRLKNTFTNRMGRRTTLELMPDHWKRENIEDAVLDEMGLRAPRDGSLIVFEHEERPGMPGKKLSR